MVPRRSRSEGRGGALERLLQPSATSQCAWLPDTDPGSTGRNHRKQYRSATKCLSGYKIRPQGKHMTKWRSTLSLSFLMSLSGCIEITTYVSPSASGTVVDAA